MSLAPFVAHTQVDLVKEVQSYVESDILTNPSRYGVILNPKFLPVGPDGGMIEITYSPEILKTRKPGSLIRTRTSVLKKSWKAKLTFKASDNNTDLQFWCKNKSLKTDLNTPAASRTFLMSYNIAGVETYEIFQGCVPDKTNYTINKSGEIIYTVDLDCKTFVQNQLPNGGIELTNGNKPYSAVAAAGINVDTKIEEITVSSNGHGFAVNDFVNIIGAIYNYNGAKVTSVNTNNFNVQAPFIATDIGNINLGSFALSDGVPPWHTQDGGAGAFIYDTKTYGIESFSVDITRDWAIQDPSGALENMMVTESGYTPSGTITVQKSDDVLSLNALSTSSVVMSLTLKVGEMLDTWINVIFEGHTGIAYDGTNVAGLTDTETFSAGDFVATT